MIPKIDLHVHTNASDGKYNPGEIISMAVKHNVTALAIADHDTVDGLIQALKATQGLSDFKLVPAIELSSHFPGVKYTFWVILCVIWIPNFVRSWRYCVILVTREPVVWSLNCKIWGWILLWSACRNSWSRQYRPSSYCSGIVRKRICYQFSGSIYALYRAGMPGLC